MKDTIHGRDDIPASCVHKDESPEETIALIASILENVGIGGKTPLREMRFNPAPNCHSIRIWDPTNPRWGANGKGVTDAFSRASAYAELIERLQCYYPQWFSAVGDIIPEERLFHDEVLVPAARLWDESPKIMRALLEAPLPDEETLPCLPYWDVFARRQRMLPYALMLSCFSSNGMCAGNTVEEAVAQGLCEVIERYAARLVVTGALNPPVIPLAALPAVSSGMLDMIKDMSGEGYTAIVKDCTLGGALPALAVIVLDEANDRFNVKFGSDPVFDVALQRCVTELYQGRKELRSGLSFWKSAASPMKYFFNNEHSALPMLLANSADADPALYSRAFSAHGSSNRAYLASLLRQMRAMEAAVYVRDFSFLGFPSFQVIVDNMSPHIPLTAKERSFTASFPEALSIVFRLAESDRGDLERLARILADKLRSENVFIGPLETYFRNSHRVPAFSWLEPRTLAAFVFIETERYEDAVRLLEAPYPDGPVPAKEEALWAVLADYCRLASDGHSREGVVSRLRALHGEGPFGEGLEHLVDKSYAALYRCAPSANAAKYAGLPLPHCADPFSCGACPLNSGCALKRFLEVRGKIKNAYTPVDQERLGAVLNELVADGEDHE